MKVATDNNQAAQLHVAELLEIIDDSLRFGRSLQGETRHFLVTTEARLRAGLDYLANNLHRGEQAVWGFEPFDDSVNLWAG
jgi:hypothetical protein